MTTNPVFFRSDYSGRTDKYAFVPVHTQAKLDEAMRGVRPSNVAGTVLSDSYVEYASTRLADYRLYFDYYRGVFPGHWDRIETPGRYNFCRPIVDKRASWAIGKGIEFIPVRGNELVSDLFLSVWKSNGFLSLLSRLQKTAYVFGDAFLFFSVITTDSTGVTLPRDRWRVSMTSLNPQYCFPIWSERDPSVMQSLLLQFPALYPGEDGAPPSNRLCSILLGEKEIVTYVDDSEISRKPNPIGMIPAVHLPYDQITGYTFGTSLLREIGGLNMDFLDTRNAIRRIIKYHGEPTTIVFGARLADMERAAGKIWSGLAKDAKVETLKLTDADLTHLHTDADNLTAQIHTAARVPRIAFDASLSATSHSSGVAVAMLFQPLIEASTEDQRELTVLMNKANAIIAAIHQNVLGDAVEDLADEPGQMTDIEYLFQSMLPIDEAAELDRGLKLLEKEAISLAEFVRRYVKVRDTRRHALELAADRMSKAATIEQEEGAKQGKPLNPRAFFLGSPFIAEDLVALASTFTNTPEGAGAAESNRA